MANPKANKKLGVGEFSIEDLWPPDWFFSYTDLATLLMTFFVVLATMITLEVDIAQVKEGISQIKLEKAGFETVEELVEVVKKLTEREKTIVEIAGKIDDEQLSAIEKVLEIDIRDLLDKLNEFIIASDLEQEVLLESDGLRVKIIPKGPFLFVKGGDALRPRAKDLIDKVVTAMKNMDMDVNMRIEGHTDNIPISTPRFASNWELSIARANSVMKYLVEAHDIDPKMIEAVGCGEFKPVAPNDTEENRAKNRRVVFEITPTEEKVKD